MVKFAGIDYEKALSLRRSWLSILSLAVILAVAAAAVLATQTRRAFMPGGLSSAHERVRALDHCDRCHQPFQRVSGAMCQECHHQSGHGATAGPSCGTCHPEHRGQKVLATVAAGRCTEGCHRGMSFGPTHPQLPRTAFTRVTFKHDVHKQFACTKCHGSDETQRPTREVCVECHGARAGVRASPCVTCHRYHTSAPPSHDV